MQQNIDTREYRYKRIEPTANGLPFATNKRSSLWFIAGPQAFT